MKKYLYSILLLFVVFLTGCGTKDVVYDAEETVDGNTAEEGTGEKESGSGTLEQTLGIENNTWKEQIGSGRDTIFVNAKVNVPEVTDMYTQEVSEHYYTPEEQKKLAEYFMDEDTIRVNKEAVITKEWVQKRLDYYSEILEFEEEESSLHSSKEYIAMLTNEKNRLEDLINEAPAMDDVSDTVQDYSENHYIGSKGDVEYTLSFNVDEETNTSSWTLEATDGDDFAVDEIETRFKPWHVATPYYEGDNICEMTREQACAQAEELCEKIGISDMKAVGICDLQFFLARGGEDGFWQFGASDVYDEAYEFNGYYIVLVREINDVAVDSTIYDGDGIYLDTNTMEKPYDKEKVVIELNDKGIISMTYEGCLTAKEVGNEVKLLSYDQILEIFRKELESLEKEMDTWRSLSLVYVRVADEAETDQYRYIPAWCLSTDQIFGGITYGPIASFGTTLADYTIWINAIDGTRIYPDKAGFVHYTTPNEYSKDMQVYFDREEDY